MLEFLAGMLLTLALIFLAAYLTFKSKVNDKYCITLRFEKQTEERFKKLMEETNQTAVEVIRRALSVYDFCIKEIKKENIIMVERPDGNVEISFI